MEIAEIAALVDATIISETSDSTIQHLSIDSRSAKNTESELFIALKGPNHDGHRFIYDLAEKGCKNFIVEDDIKRIEGCNILKVASSLRALQKISAYQRSRFEGTVVGITGSNGKTIVKEWLYTILSSRYNVLKSPKSYNSQVGVPLSIWPIDNKYDVGVFEAGISAPNEMEYLESVIVPNIGIFTNIGTAHEEFFESEEAKVKEKLKLFKNSQALIFRTEKKKLRELIEKDFSGHKICWSFKEGAEYKVELNNSGQITINHKDNTFQFEITLSDDASVENIVHCIITALYLGLDQQEIQRGLFQVSPVKMRLELKKGINNCYVIDDSYNNDLVGLQKALEFMDQQKHMVNKTLVLSDFVQNDPSGSFYADLNELFVLKGIDKLIGIGNELSQHSHAFKMSCSFYPDTKSFLASDEIRQFHNELILIKGARRFKLEDVSKSLAEKAHKTVLEINLDAITHNLNFYRSTLKPNTKLMVVVKALAYGAGSAEISKMLEFHKVDYLAVAYADEGVSLRKNGITLPIMVMNPSGDDILNLIEYNLEPEIYSLSQLKQFLSIYKLTGTTLHAHFILNTGMNRLGFNTEDIGELCSFISTENNLKIRSIFSHLAASEEEKEEDFTKSQALLFRELASRIEAVLTYKPIRHILNSGGIIRHNEFQEDMVRLGIGLHGVEVSDLKSEKLMKPATLKTVISQIRTVKAGETIGYGRKGHAEADIKIATIAIGYADGYLRYFGNGKAYVTINGFKVPTIGNICMDMSMVDVTGLDVNVGDEVVVFGNDPSINQLASWADTIPYEILTNVSNRVNRVFYTE